MKCHNAAFHQGLLCLLRIININLTRLPNSQMFNRWLSEKKIQVSSDEISRS